MSSPPLDASTDKEATRMSQDADLEIEDDDEPGPKGLRNKLKAAESRAREAEERATANEAAARRVAFMDAGIPDSPQTRFFMEKYDGVLTGEAIKSAAQSNGFLEAQAAETNAEVEQIDGMSQVAQGAENPEAAGSQEAIDREMREAAESAVRNGEDVADAITAVQRRHGRPTAVDTQ